MLVPVKMITKALNRYLNEIRDRRFISLIKFILLLPASFFLFAKV